MTLHWHRWNGAPPGDALRESDPEIAALIEHETTRQNDGLELIASENFVSPAVLEAMGSPLTNKYAEGLPGKRYYGGCEVVDRVEQLAIDRAKQLFGADHANVQPHSGATANAAVYLAFLKPGDTILGLDLSHGGHLTHGSPVNSSGLLYSPVHYTVDDDGFIDYDRMEALAREHRPKLIIAGYSAYSRVLDYERFAAVAREVGAIFMVDMAHFAGLVAAGVYPSPIPHADVVTTTTHKTLRGPRGGLILCRAEHQKAIDKAMFPGTQGGPLEHVIAAKAVAFREALQPEFKEYCRQVVANARALAAALGERGLHIVSGGTDNHLMLVDLRSRDLTGKVAEKALDRAGITVNKNTVPKETQSPFVTSGIRVGTPAVTTRGMREPEMARIAELMDTVLRAVDDEEVAARVREEVRLLTRDFPLYPVPAVARSGPGLQKGARRADAQLRAGRSPAASRSGGCGVRGTAPSCPGGAAAPGPAARSRVFPGGVALAQQLAFRDGIMDRIRMRETRFHEHAYLFVLSALEWCQQHLSERRHISGGELAHACRDLALERYGVMAKLVLDHWGIRSTADIGDVVFTLVDLQLLISQPTDSRDDFVAIYDFETAFERDYPWHGAFKA